ncbi:MAG: PglZ domain-containing protein [Saprospirales bacterium]|jgi:CheY-like chemotaxis protein|nr:MAG: PglZ domain-containing protein [Saprospirales bacterium]
MSNINILWADDEIDLLKPLKIFLEKKDYKVEMVSNGYDAIEVLKSNPKIDVVFLDESMPGMSGLETLTEIKQFREDVPVVMITKNEAENIMDEAIGSQIADYLIKPVNPHQILLSLKKIIDNKRLVEEKTSSDYQQEFRKLLMEINSGPDLPDWIEIYKKIVSWELKLGGSQSDQMMDILTMQKKEANAEWSKYVVRNYSDWLEGASEGQPLMSHTMMRREVLPYLQDGIPTFFILMDNMRYDQWKVIEPILKERFYLEKESHFISILPTTTQYSRNAIFAGLMPSDIQKRFPDKWLNDIDDGGKNMYEEDFLKDQLSRLVRREIKSHYVKVTRHHFGKQLPEQMTNFLNNDLTVIVYNFIDMLSHARTEMEVLKELAADEAAYRSITRSWFLHSPLWAGLQRLADKDVRIIFTTDHGTIRVSTPSKVVGDKETTTNLRYKVGKNLRYDSGDVLEVREPHTVGLPRPNISSAFIFAKEDKFFLYPNNYNYYHNYYQDTFQHGGISLEEMICPIGVLRSK